MQIDIKYYKNSLITDNIITHSQFCQINEYINRLKYIHKLFNITLHLYVSYEIENSIFNFSILYTHQQNLFKINSIGIKSNNLIHNDTLNYIYNIYKYKTRSIIKYLISVPDFLNKILSINNSKLKISNTKLSNSINPNYIAFLKPQEIDPESFTEILEKKQKKEEKANNIVYSDAYSCRRCKQMKCTSKIIATRAADENLTTIVKCHNCYNVFTV